MFTRLRQFSRDQKGTTASIFALATLPLMMVSGAAVDYSRATSARSKLQQAVDMAAMKAVLSPQLDIAATNTVADAFGDTPTALNVSVSNGEVTVEATASVKTSVLNAVRIETVDVSARARAMKMFEGFPPCILALNPSAYGSITFGGSSDFQAKDCVVHTNSNHGSGLVVEGSARPVASGFCSVGGVSAPSDLKPRPRENCDPMKDPFAGLPHPYSSACDYKNVVVEPKQTRTLKPGVYCGGLALKGTVTLEPGVYVVRDGLLEITSQSNVTGDGITFFLTGSNAGFTFDAGGILDLKAPTSGTYGGILVFQDPNANPYYSNKVVGGSDSVVVGALYAPTQTVVLQGGSGFGQKSSFMPVIADQIRVAGSTITTSDISGTELAAPLPKSFSGVRLVE